MNEHRRGKILKSVQVIEEQIASLREVAEEEQQALDNLPESLQGGDRADKMRVAIDQLETASDQIESATCDLCELLQ